MAIKLSKRQKPTMVYPGIHDSSVLPSGGNMGVGLSLDYRALSADTGLVVNNTDDNDDLRNELHALLKLLRGKNIWSMLGHAINAFYAKKDMEELLKKEVAKIRRELLLIDESEEIKKRIEVVLDKMLAKKTNKADDINPYGSQTNNYPNQYGFVGQKEDGFPIRHNMDYAPLKNSSKKFTAVIIKGNSKYVDGNKLAEKFYADIKEYLETKGYKVSIEHSNDDNVPKKADLWVGHSKGIKPLLNASQDIKRLGLGVLKDKIDDKSIVVINHPKDEIALKKSAKIIDEHYIFTDEMKVAIDKMTEELMKNDVNMAMDKRLQQVKKLFE